MTYLKLNQRTTSRFRLPLHSEKDACNALHKSMIAETRRKGRQLDMNEDYLKQVREVAQWLYNQQTSGLLICGKVGNGKTATMDAVIALYTLGDFFDNGIKIGFKRLDALALTDIYNESRDEFQAAKRCPMLAIDDLGCENVNVQKFGNETSPITELIAYRYQEQKLTIITTNLTSDMIRERYGERIADRLKEMMTMVIFRNKSYR